MGPGDVPTTKHGSPRPSGREKWYSAFRGVVHASEAFLAGFIMQNHPRRRPHAHLFESKESQEYALVMQIGQKLKELREAQGLTQADVGKETGLFASYMS